MNSKAHGCYATSRKSSWDDTLFADFEKAYLACGLWTEHGIEGPVPAYPRSWCGTWTFVSKRRRCRFLIENRAQVRKEVEQFFTEIAKDRDIYKEVLGRIEDAGHDFWLTRNGEGAGFWSRTGDHEWKYGDSLTKIASKFPPAHLLETDETGGFTYFSG